MGTIAVGIVGVGNCASSLVQGIEFYRAADEKVGAEHFPAPHRFDDAAWISYRLSEVLPISLDIKQQLLQLADPQARLSQLTEILSQQGFHS